MARRWTFFPTSRPAGAFTLVVGLAALVGAASRLAAAGGTLPILPVIAAIIAVVAICFGVVGLVAPRAPGR